MKILFVNEIGGLWGGVEQNILLSIRGLSELGHQCHLYCTKYSDRGLSHFEESCRSITSSEDGLTVEACINEVSPDVIYLHKFADITPLLPFTDTIRMVRMVHDHDLYCPRRHKYFFHNRKICHHAAGAICYADLAFLERKPSGKMGLTSIEKKIRQMRLNNRLHTLIIGSTYMRNQLVINGFDERKIRQLAPSVKFGDIVSSEAKDTKRVLYVGQLIRGKGVDLLLTAFEQVDKSVCLDIVGQGNDLGMLQQMISDNPALSSRVKIHGWIDPHELIEIYDQAMVTVVPSRWPEPFGMVGLEAMLRRRPVVAFEVGGIPDWLEDGVTGFLVPEADTDEFARCINKLTGDLALVRKMGEDAEKIVKKRFSFERYMKELENILKGEEE